MFIACLWERGASPFPLTKGEGQASPELAEGMGVRLLGGQAAVND